MSAVCISILDQMISAARMLPYVCLFVPSTIYLLLLHHSQLPHISYFLNLSHFVSYPAIPRSPCPLLLSPHHTSHPPLLTPYHVIPPLLTLLSCPLSLLLSLRVALLWRYPNRIRSNSGWATLPGTTSSLCVSCPPSSTSNSHSVPMQLSGRQS